MNCPRPRGFTLIELMVALLVSSLLVGMILAIFSRMSLAYHGQQQIAGVQQILAAARAAIELDAKQAGLGMAQGFKTAIPGRPALESPVQVTNSSTAPDQVAFFYADPSAQALVDPVPNALGKTAIIVADAITATSPFRVGDLVVLTTASTASSPPPFGGTSPDIATYDACVVKIATVTPASRQYTFEAVAPWGSGTEDHCTAVTPGRTMVYRFVAHAYRIDPTPAKLALGVLDRGTTGNLLGNAEVWDELAYGFSDLQTAVRIYNPAATVDLDLDGDIPYNWYSSDNQNGATRLGAGLQVPLGSAVLGISISLVAHTDRNVEGIATRATPSLIAAPTADNNPLGDRASTVLPDAPPWPDPLLPGLRIYRHTTFQVDFRNLGVGLTP